MMNIRKLLTVGGDERMLYTSQSLAEKGFDVEIFAPSPPAGFEHMRPTGDKSIDSAAARADAVILPLPVSRDGVHLNSSPLTLNELSDTLERGQTVFAGMMDGALKSSFFKKGIRVFDYFEREELAVNNAVPTAQGVIKIAMENMKITVHGALNAVNISELMKTAPELDLLVNTVPSLVLDCKTLSALRRDCLVIDIASAPYGTDFACARELGLNVIVPGSLPGKTAPKTAGEIIADAILNIIKEGS